MNERRGLLAAGNWIIDHNKVVDVYPAQDALSNILETSIGNGGSPFNILVDLARLGASFPLEAAGLIGQDANGRAILEICKHYRLDTQQLHEDKQVATSYTDVMTVQSTGRRTFFHHRGANARLGPEHLDLSLSQARIFHLGYLLLLDRLDGAGTRRRTLAAEVLEEASSRGFKTSIDVVSEDGERFSEIVVPALPFTDYCILNDFEAARTTKRCLRRGDLPDVHEMRLAAQDLLDWGVREWVIIHFPEGALAAHKTGELLIQPSLKLPEDYIAGSSGAGDAFAAAVLMGLHAMKTMAECLVTGMCVAASCLSDCTTSGGVKTLEECMKLSERFGMRGSVT